MSNVHTIHALFSATAAASRLSAGLKGVGSSPSTPPAAPELDLCSRCQDHAEFELLDNQWVSGCCTAPAISPDVPSWMEDL